MRESYEPYDARRLNAFNDSRIHGGHTFHMNADTHILFEWVPEVGKWVIAPMKMYPHSSIFVDNMHILIRIHPPEGIEPQTTLRDISDIEFARIVMNALDDVNLLGEPLCIRNLEKAIAKMKSIKRN